MYGGTCSQWILYSWLLIHSAISFTWGQSRCGNNMRTDCSTQPKWYGIVKLVLIMYILCFRIHGSHILFVNTTEYLHASYHDSTFAACSFHAVLNQAMELLGFCWYYICWLKAHLKWTIGSFAFCLDPSIVTILSVCSNVGRSCSWTCEAKESELIHMLLYINDVLGYTTGDVEYTDYVCHGT
jgi:hypothetical protein